VVAISTDLDLHRVLSRIVGSACELTEARYGALGVLDADEGLQDFVIHGIEPSLKDTIGALPHGRGILGLVIKDPRPLRLSDLTEHPASYGFPPHHPEMKTFLGVPLEVQGTVFGNLYLTEKADGREFTDEDEETVVALAAAAGYVIGNARAYSLSERRRQWAEATGHVSDALQPPIELNEAFAEVTRILRSVTGARAVAVFRPASHGGVELEAIDGPERVAAGAVIERDGRRLLAAEDLTDGLPIVLDGVQRWAVVLPLRSALREAAMLIAVVGSEEVVRDPQEQQLMQTFADHVGLALDRARAVEDREELAVLTDRDRIARDLHDLVIQRLFATGMQLQGLRMLADRPELVGEIDTAVDNIDITIKEIRGTIFELQGRKDASLRGDLRRLVKEFVPALGFAPSVRTVGPVDTAVPDAVQSELLAVLREALSNVAQHARAKQAAVELEVSDDEVFLRVTDDGVGLPDERFESGLRNARSRAAALRGFFAVTPGPLRGTVFTWRVPLS